MLDFGHWSVRDYVPFRHQIFGPVSIAHTLNTVCEGGSRLLATRVRGKEKTSENRQRKRKADKDEVAPGVTVRSLRGFRTALIGPTQGLPKRRQLRR